MSSNCCHGACASLEESVLNELSVQERCALRSHSVTINLKKGQNIFEQGKESEGLFCLQKGKVKVELEAQNGDRVTVSLFSDRGTLGHQNLYTPTNACTATCLTDTVVCFLPKSQVKPYLATYPAMSKRLSAIIAKEMNQLNDVILSLRSKSVVQRLAESLIRLQNIFGKDSNNCIDLDLTKEELSLMVGSSVESIFRILSDFKSKSYVEVKERRIRILSESKLRSLGRIYN